MSPICVRVLPNEAPIGSELNDPHSPMSIVNDSIIPGKFVREKQIKNSHAKQFSMYDMKGPR